jgi:hypothetical protein
MIKNSNQRMQIQYEPKKRDMKFECDILKERKGKKNLKKVKYTKKIVN